VGRQHLRLVGDTEVLENRYCVLHGVPVRTGAHDNTDFCAHLRMICALCTLEESGWLDGMG
jgi:hypothetical protein